MNSNHFSLSTFLTLVIVYLALYVFQAVQQSLSRVMQGLDTFPVEILAQILNDEDSFLAVDLWKCGSRNLNSKLSRGGVTNVKLIAKPLDHPGRWPRCLKEFKLERLSIVSHQHALCSVATLRKELKQLNGDLKELEIIAPGVCLALFGGSSKKAVVDTGDSDDMEQPKAAKRLKHQETADDRDHEEIWNLDVTWSCMERLTFGGDDYGLPPCIFALLPRSLLYLHINVSNADTIANLSTLPPKLQTLHIPCVINSSKAIATLPRSITDIGSSIDEETLLKLAKRPSLLPNLAHFPWEQDEDANGELKEWIFDEGGKWPQSILSLRFAETGPGDIFGTKLPQALQSLSITASYADYEIDHTYLQNNIPKSLTELQVDKIDFSQIDASMWPSGLIKLSLNDGKFDLQWFHKLPRSLTTFSSSVDEPYETREHDDVPPFELDVALENGRTSLATLDHDLWQSIKTDLVKKSKNGDDTAAYIKAIESGRLFGLPLTLTSLNLGMTLHRESYTLLMPPRLVTHELHTGKRFTSPQFFELLPPSLRTMQFADSYSEHSKKVWEAFSTKELADSGIYRASNLHTLYLDVDFGSDLVGSIFKYLPRTLKRLRVNTKSRVTAEEVADLPPTLTTLFLALKKMKVPQAWAYALPKSLTDLTSKICIAGNEFAVLPPNLRAIHIDAYDVTVDHLLSLPKHLSQVVINIMKTTATNDADGFIRDHQIAGLLNAFSPFWLIHDASPEVIQFEIALSTKARNDERALDDYKDNQDFFEEGDAFDDTSAPLEKEDGSENLKDADDDSSSKESDGENDGENDANNENEVDAASGDDNGDEEAIEDEEVSLAMDVVAPQDESDGGDDSDGGDSENDDESEAGNDDENGEDEDENDENDEEEEEGEEYSGEEEENGNLTPEDAWQDPKQTDIDPRTIRRIRGLP